MAALLQLEENAGALPDVWGVVYKAALALAKSAAVDEMLGNVSTSLQSYAKVGTPADLKLAEEETLCLDSTCYLPFTNFTTRCPRFKVCLVAVRGNACEVAIYSPLAVKPW